MAVANTILEQLGGRKFLVMTGAKNLIGSQTSLTMKVNGRYQGKKVNKVTIRLDPSDTYTVEAGYFAMRQLTTEIRATREGVYCDNLQAVFTSLTGLATKL
jgi:hypothetical protein